MKVLKAKIKKSSVYYRKGLDRKGKSVWLTIISFNAKGLHNFKVKAIRGYKDGFALYEEIWLSYKDVTFKQIDEDQLSLDIYSKEELEENKNNPKYFNQRRYEVISDTEKLFVHAPDLKTARQQAIEMGLGDIKIKQVRRRTKRELDES